MLEDYREQLTSPPNGEQAQRMVSILSAAMLTALRTLPHTPENEAARGILDMGMVMAMYEKIADVMPKQEFLKEIERMMEEKEPKPAFWKEMGTLLS